MTLREESGNGPPAEPAAGTGLPEPAVTPEAAEGRASPPGPGTGAAPTPPGGPASAGGPQTAPAPAGPAGPGPGTALAPPDGPAHPATPSSPGSTPRRRRSRGALLIGGSAAICLIGLGSFAAVLLLHQRAHAALALPAVFRLRTGECVSYGPGGISSPTVVPCSQPHDAEIYARFGLTGQRWPGTTAIGTLARQGCTARLGSYLNPELATTVLAESYVFPDQGAWNAGERTIICEIRGTAGKLTGSVRGLG
ncbi:MAG TPA: septum formation family protein [Streptosporangiaceae bacterium]|nr:septum formation family protein [Streptosporangiaceae bacterium]